MSVRSFAITGDACTVDCREYHVMWASKKQRRDRGDDLDALESDMCRKFKQLDAAYGKARALADADPALLEQVEIYRINGRGNDLQVVGVYSLSATGLHHVDLDG